MGKEELCPEMRELAARFSKEPVGEATSEHTCAECPHLPIEDVSNCTWRIDGKDFNSRSLDPEFIPECPARTRERELEEKLEGVCDWLKAAQESTGTVTSTALQNLRTSARQILKRLKKDNQHYVVIGFHTGEQIGCTWGEEGKKAVLAEEPKSKFIAISKEACKVCNGEI